MRTIVSLLLVGLMASVAAAGLDPDPDSMGIYFDPAGDSVCADQPIFAPFNCYLILMNATRSTYGFACTVRIEGSPYFILSQDFPVPGVIELDPGTLSYAVSSSTPFPENGGARLLVSYQLMLQGSTPLWFYVGPPSPPPACGLPLALADDGQWRCCGVTSGDVNLPVASVNAGCGVVEETTTSFGAVKGLFR